MKSANRDARIAAAAILAARGEKQADIGKKLGDLTQSSVSRLLEDAEKRGWIVKSVHFLEEEVGSQIRREAELLLFPHDLLSRITQRFPQTCLRRVCVFDSGGTGTTDKEIKERYSRFGRAAAQRLSHMLKLAGNGKQAHRTGEESSRESDSNEAEEGVVRIAGVTWGRTIHAVVRGLERLHHKPIRTDSPIEFVPLCCEPIGLESEAISSSHLASLLRKRINDGKGEWHSFTGVPAFIPISFTRKEQAVVEKLLRCIPSYSRIFSEPSGRRTAVGGGLVGNLDLLLSSVGKVPLGYFGEEWLRVAGIDRKALSRLVLGDIGGILIPRTKLGASQRAKIDRWNAAWTGVKFEHLRQVAESGRKPGVVVAAVSARKAEIVLEIVKLKLVNELLIDQDLATAIVKLLDGKS